VGLFGLISDVHATRRPPSSCTDTYLPDLLDLLRQAFALFTLRGVLAVVIAGDLFHHKAPSRTDHALVRELAELFRAQPYKVWVTPGNHDMQNDRIASVSQVQPLGVLFGTGAAHCLDGWMDKHPVFGVPWLQRWSEQGVADALTPWNDQLFGRSLIVTHAPIYPPGSEPRYADAEYTPVGWWAGPMEDGSMGHGLFYGHVHEPHGVWECRGVRFCNNGALSRGSLDEYNLERPVGVTLWDERTGEFEFAPLEARPAAQVFRLTEHEQAVTSQRAMGDFLAEIGTAVLPRVTPEGVMTDFRSRGVTGNLLALCEDLVGWSDNEGKRS
jgi:DNA repair exonuclease SbcCD nuclease subunit